jgi:tetratricopeptide (TPR) repeat protein
VLAWAAVAGRRFDAEVLAEAVQAGAPHLSGRLDAHLDTLLRAGLLHECPRLPGDMLEFRHDLLREVVLAEGAEEQEQRERHRCVGQVKQRLAECGDRSLLPEVAHHFLEARDWLEAVRYHKHAGDATRDSLAFREAASLYETAARLLSEKPGLALTPGERPELYESQAVALETLGRMDEALVAYRAAQAEVGEDRVRWARYEHSAAWFLSRKGQLDEAAAACERARDVLAPAGAELDLADALRMLGHVGTLRGQYEEAAANLQSALALYQRVGHRERLGRCYQTLAFLHSRRGDWQALLEATQQELAISEELGQPILVGQSLNNVAYTLVLLGRGEEALPLLLRAAEIFERHYVEKDLPNVYHSLAEAMLNCGRAKEAGPYLERGLESARRVGEVRTITEFHSLLARHRSATGCPDEARAQFEEAMRVCSASGLASQRAEICLEFAEFLLADGEPEEALRCCQEALAIRRRLGTEGVAEAADAVVRARKAAGVT